MNSGKHNIKGVNKREFTDVVLIGIVLLHVVVFPVQAAIFTTSDLEGSWEVHMLTSGDYPQWTGWMYGTMNIDISGNSTFTSITRSDGYSTLPGNVKTAISPSGLVTFTGIDFYGIMNSQKDMIVGVMTDGGGGYDLTIYTKHGTSTYTTSDLEGTWNCVGLISGDAPAQTPGWCWGAMTFNQEGDLIGATPVTDSLGNSDYVPSGSGLDISSTGVITDSRGLIRGVMNPEKDMIVSIGTLCPGRDTAVCGYNLIIWIKESETSFTISDLEGTWDFHSLTSGDSPQHTGWAHGIQTIDADGNCSFTSITRSNGDSTIPEDVTVAISSSGVATHAGTDFHGIMNSRKDIIVGVMTDGGDGYGLVVSVRGVRTMYSFASCSGASTNKYNPSAVGYGWTYDGFGEYSGHTKTVDVISTEPVYGVSCLKVRVQDPVEGLRYAWIAEDMQGNAHIFRFQYESQPWVQINSDDDIPNIHFIASPEIGDTWKRDFDGFGTAEFEVMSMDATAGVYENCMKVKVSYSGGGEIHAYYYKEGIGLVKDEQWDASSGFILKLSTQNGL